MNQFQSMDSGQGLLKQSYDDGSSPLSDALKKRRMKKVEERGMDVNKDNAPEDKDEDEK